MPWWDAEQMRHYGLMARYGAVMRDERCRLQWRVKWPEGMWLSERVEYLCAMDRRASGIKN